MPGVSGRANASSYHAQLRRRTLPVRAPAGQRPQHQIREVEPSRVERREDPDDLDRRPHPRSPATTRLARLSAGWRCRWPRSAGQVGRDLDQRLGGDLGATSAVVLWATWISRTALSRSPTARAPRRPPPSSRPRGRPALLDRVLGIMGAQPAKRVAGARRTAAASSPAAPGAAGCPRDCRAGPAARRRPLERRMGMGEQRTDAGQRRSADREQGTGGDGARHLSRTSE